MREEKKENGKGKKTYGKERKGGKEKKRKKGK